MEKPNEFKRVDFVEYMPHEKEPLVLYVSMRFRLVICKCPCGCGIDAVMPIKPKSYGWDFIEKEGKVTLSPSVATNCPNKAHFYIRDNKIQWL